MISLFLIIETISTLSKKKNLDRKTANLEKMKKGSKSFDRNQEDTVEGSGEGQSTPPSSEDSDNKYLALLYKLSDYWKIIVNYSLFRTFML